MKLVNNRRLKLVQIDNEYSLLEYTPSLVNPLLSGFDNPSISRRIRLSMNLVFRSGYTVYYLSNLDEIVATCTVVKGKGLLWMCNENDITIEMVFVPENFRGHGYAKQLIKMITEENIDYDVAYAWISKRNPASYKSFEAVGFEVCGECEVKRFSRKLYYNTQGYNLINIYKRNNLVDNEEKIKRVDEV